MDNYDDPIPGKTYFSPSLKAFGDSERRVRIASKMIESPDTYAFSKIKDELVLRHKEDATTYIKASFFEDDRRISVLNIQGFSVATDKPHNASFAFLGDEITKLIEFAKNIQEVSFTGRGPVNISDDELRRLALSNQQARDLVEDNEELFAEVLRSSITKSDVVAVGYRKKQLEVFRLLLEDQSYFDSLKARKNCTDESLWQQFFEKNQWIFGYGLSYLYLASLDDKKLEQVVAGHHVSGHGKRVDALMKSKGLVSSLCFVEIKTHKTSLLSSKPYRVGCWAPSTELSGAVSQVQGTVALAMDTIRGKLALTDAEGFPTGEETFNYLPKAFLVAGSLSEFIGEHGVNHEQYRSLELFRRSMVSPELMTFDELYERAKFIVQSVQN
jgi:predicted Holliday junction resolvase-like endonuclease